MAEHGVFVYFAVDQLNSRKREDLIRIAANSLEDFKHNEKLAVTVFRGIKGSVKRGYSGGGKRYGYRSVQCGRGKNGRPLFLLQIIPEEACTLILIFRLFGRKYWSVSKIVKFLNKAYKEKGKHRPPNGKAWRTATICNSQYLFQGMFYNEIYRGEYIWNKRRKEKNLKTGKEKLVFNPREKWIVREAPELRIISDELWNAVHARLSLIKKKSHDGRKSKKMYSQNPLTPVCRCKLCRGTFPVCSGRGEFTKCGCSTRHNGSRFACSNAIKIYKTVLESTVLNVLRKAFVDDESLSALLKEMHILLSDLVAKEMNTQLRQRIDTLELQIRNMIDIIKMGKGIEPESLLFELKNSEMLKKELSKQIVEVSPDDDAVKSLFTMEDLTSYCQDILIKLNNPQKIKEVIAKVIDKIYVGPTDIGAAEIEIVENVEDIGSYVIEKASARNGILRYLTRAGWLPYHPRTFTVILPKENFVPNKGEAPQIKA